MARPKSINGEVFTLRMRSETLKMLHDLANLESISTGKKVTANELIRTAIDFTYSDNERMREAFRRSRSHIAKRLK